MLNTKQIQEILPHRHPFLLVDRIEELKEGVRARGKKRTKGKLPFSEESKMPGSGIRSYRETC